MNKQIDYQKLLDVAVDAATRAYAPYSNYHVGAAILTSDGRIFSGCNVENNYIGSGICAERTAMVKAVSEGARDFVACAVACATDYRCYPCGLCRQFLSEFGPDLEIVVREVDGFSVKTIGELLPQLG
ncbi:MAG: cytidine deaminase [Candidatus Obscuribacter sp.]|jgi:cytidine deaminase|nr:cytidine deaminase [Candidatus Obscuribacter sp.]